jgi:hypothetical protein
VLQTLFPCSGTCKASTLPHPILPICEQFLIWHFLTPRCKSFLINNFPLPQPIQLNSHCGASLHQMKSDRCWFLCLFSNSCGCVNACNCGGENDGVVSGVRCFPTYYLSREDDGRGCWLILRASPILHRGLPNGAWLHQNLWGASWTGQLRGSGDGDRRLRG